MIENILFWIFAAVSILYVVHLGLYLIGANLYDIWQYRRLHHGGRPKNHPLVSVLIPAHNEEKVLLRCLDSIRGSSYKNLQIIVVDDASTDRTLSIARQYRRKHRYLTMTVVHMSKNVGKGEALNRALQRFVKGELVMTLDADSLIAPDSIIKAVSYFDDPRIAGVAANVRVIEEPNVLGVLQTLEHMIGYRSKKLYSVTNCEFIVGGVASTYRMSVLREAGFYDTDTLTEDIGLSTKVISSTGNRLRRVVYAADVLAFTEGVASYRALLKQRYRWKFGAIQNLIKYRRLIGLCDKHFSYSLTLYRLPVAIISEVFLLLAPVVWGYVAYVSITAQDPRLIVGAYFTMTAYILMTLWFDEHTSFWSRLRMSIYAPMMYFIFYIMDFVQLLAVLNCTWRIRSLLKQKNTGSVWVSPQRVGREVS